jgi:hypothetical protein
MNSPWCGRLFTNLMIVPFWPRHFGNASSQCPSINDVKGVVKRWTRKKMQRWGNSLEPRTLKYYYWLDRLDMTWHYASCS